MEKIKKETTFVCNYHSYKGECDERLNLFGEDAMNVKPQISLFREYFQDVSPRLIDFIEIATFIYVADQSVVRCQGIVDPYGLRWNRIINMIIAVQDYEFWSNPEVISILEHLLQFMSDDHFCFKFVKMDEKPPEQHYLVFDDKMGESRKPERVMLFSGGLDSLGGAIESLFYEGKQTVMVRHKSTTKHKDHFSNMQKELREKSGGLATFFTFKAEKDGGLSKEYTQRTRSLLYFAFASVVANLLNINEVRFYENGPVSINLPMSPQVIGGKATRTTHPKTLHYFQELFRKISGNSNFAVLNPFINKTKSDIVRFIIDQNFGYLIKDSMSCAHSWQQKKFITHCGVCSQCIDRRVAIIAANAQEYDSERDYKVDFFTQSVDSDKSHRNDDHFDAPYKNLLASFFLRGIEISGLSFDSFQERFPEISDAILYMGNDPYVAAQDIYRLYRRLAEDIQKVIQYAKSDKFKDRLSDPFDPLPDDCLSYILTRKTSSQSRIGTAKPESDYEFKCRGEIWELRFNGGKPFLLKHSVGFPYIAKVLTSPNKYFEYEEFLKSESPDYPDSGDWDDETESIHVTNYLSNEPAADKKSKAKLWERLQELDQTINDKSNLSEEIEEAEKEKERIFKQLKRDYNKRGEPRNISSEKKRKHDSVQSAINSVLKRIAKYDPDLSKHIQGHLEYVFGALVYKYPGIPFKWDT